MSMSKPGQLALIKTPTTDAGEVHLVRYEQMCKAIAECHRIDEAKDIRDKAEALRAYCRQTENKQLEVQFAEIKLRAERKAGELLIEMRKSGHLAAKGDNQYSGSDKLSLPQIGIEPKQSERFQQVANVPAESFESVMAEAREKQQPVASAQVRRLASAPKQAVNPILTAIVLESLPNGKPIAKGDPAVLDIWGQFQRWEETLLADPKMTPEYIVMGLPRDFWPDLVRGANKLISLLENIKGVIHENTLT